MEGGRVVGGRRRLWEGGLAVPRAPGGVLGAGKGVTGRWEWLVKE